jgi:hypothetical protein
MLGISDRLLAAESEEFARTIHTVVSPLTGKSRRSSLSYRVCGRAKISKSSSTS